MVLKRALPYSNYTAPALKMRRLTAMPRRLIRYKSSSSSGMNISNNTMNAASGVFGTVGSSKTSYRRKRISKRRGKALKRIKRFNAKVRKAVRGLQMMSLYFDTTANGSPMVVTGNSTGINLGTLAGGNQLILGSKPNDFFWGLAYGSTTSAFGLNYISSELGDWRARVNAADQPVNAERPTNMKIYVQSATKTVSFSNQTKTQVGVPNVSPALSPLDIRLDIYEFVAAKDIDDPLYATPATAWYNLNANAITTGNITLAYQKGMTPLDQPELGKYWKLLKKTKLTIPYNSEEGVNPYVTYTFKTKRFVWDVQKMDNVLATKGITKFICAIIAPDNSDSHFSQYGSGAFWGATDITHVHSNSNIHFKPINNMGNLATIGSSQNRLSYSTSLTPT